jgi:GAF domain-containing protein
MDSLVDQLEAALETARLYSDTRQRAQREQMMQEVTDRLHRSLDMDTLMRTLLQEVSAALDVEQAFVQLSTPSEIAE